MKLSSHNITTAKLFRLYFNAKEILSNVRLFMVESQKLGFNENENKLLQVISRSLLDNQTVDVTFTEDQTFLSIGDISCPVRYMVPVLDKIKESDLPVMERSRLAGILSLYELARIAPSDVDEVFSLCNFNRTSFDQFEEKLADEPTLIEVDSRAEPYKFNLVPLKERLEGEIRTVKLVNGSSSQLGFATLQIIGDGGVVIKSYILKSGEVLFGNFIGNHIIEFFPRMSISCEHCIYIKKIATGKQILERRIFYDNSIITYPVEKLGEVSQFAADDENGFVCIVDKQIVVYSRLFNNKTFAINYQENEHPVKVAVRGSAYLVLTNKGRVYSNCDFDREGILSISINQNQTAYAITSSGEIIANRDISTTLKDKDSIAEVYFLWAYAAVFKNRDGQLNSLMDLAGVPDEVNKVLIYSGLPVYLDFGGVLYFGMRKKMAEAVEDFDISEDKLIIYRESQIAIEYIK